MLIRCPWRLLLPSILVRRCVSLFYHGGISEGGREMGGGVDRQALSFVLRRLRTMRRIMLTTQTLIKYWLVVEFYSSIHVV